MTNKPEERELRAYAVVRRLAEHAVADLTERISKTVAALGDPNLVRARLADKRIKSHSSLSRKSQQQGWGFEEALRRAQDLVGVRLVCHNLQDVRRVAKLLEASLRHDGLTVRRHDYTARAKPSGYRAIHLVLSVRVAVGKDEADIGCEIQIRSLLQDSWAELSRADVYAGAVPAPPAVQRRMKALSKLLGRADATADRIRSDIARPRRGRRPTSGQPLTDAAVAFLYRDRFGEDPPDYLVRSVVRDTKGLNVRSDGLHVVLADEAFMARLTAAYQEGSGWEAETTQLFGWAVHSLVFGKDAAVRRAGSDARSARNEIESIARREMLSDVDTIGGMLDSIEHAQKDEDPESDIERWASGLGASTSCAFCGTTIIDPDEFAAAAVRHYKVRGKRAESMREQLVDAARSTAIETGSWDNSSICSYCAHVLSKD